MENQFNSEDVLKILRNRYVVIIGDSNHRSIYKDLVLLLQKDRFLTRNELKSKGELTFLEDELVEGGVKGGLTNGTGYKEVRQFKTETHHLKFYFVTRCYNAYVKSVLLELRGEPKPSLVLMNSCVWDISRYGKTSMIDFKMNLLSLFTDIKASLPQDCLMIWDTTLPVSKNARGGFLPPEQEFERALLSVGIQEANLYAKLAAASFKICVLDLYAHLWNHTELQINDGIHWDMIAHRYITSVILKFVSGFYGSGGPSRFSSSIVHSKTSVVNKIPTLGQFPVNLAPLSKLVEDEKNSYCPTPVRARGPMRNNRRNQRLRNNGPYRSLSHESPYDDYSENDYRQQNSYGSPDFHGLSARNNFRTPNFFQNPTDFDRLQSPNYTSFEGDGQNCSNFGSYPSNNGMFRYNESNYQQSCINRQGSSSNLCPCGHKACYHNKTVVGNNNFFGFNQEFRGNVLLNQHDGYQPMQHPISRYAHSIKPLLQPRNNGFYDLGQFNNQQDLSTGAIRHNNRRQRREPYRN